MGVIFTSHTCRTTHLDIVDNLSMDACLNTIEGFMAQYGDVTTAFYLDNGTNFRGADNALRKMYTKNIHQKYQRYYSPWKISLYFNTNLASPQGSTWEQTSCCTCHMIRKTHQYLLTFCAQC